MEFYRLLLTISVLVVFASAKEVKKTTSFYNRDKCGKSMGCWSFPNDCEDQACHTIVRWKTLKNLLRIELQAKDIENSADKGRYMALGFSDDKFMDNDTIIECVFDAKGKAKAFVSYNDRTNNVQLEDASAKMVKLRQSAKSDGRLLCKIDVNFGKHKKLKEGERDTIISSAKNAQWTLLFAQGLADPKTYEKFIHAYYPHSTDELVEMCDDCDTKYQVVSQTSPHEVRRLRRSTE
ncbi:DOMON domain-containing protein [Aphelenchoides bicaudatus]|nr:DOMON domain-containing protein [Aphelenchoides bicaudatus]